MNDLLNLKEAANYVGLHPEVLRKKASLREVPAKKIGSGKKSPWRFSRSELDSWIKNDRKVEQTLAEFTEYEKKLVEKLNSTDDLERQEDIVNTLGIVGSEYCIEVLKEFLSTPFHTLRWLTVRSIINILGEESRDLVYEMQFTDEAEFAKIIIAGYYAKKGDERSLNNLREIFQKCDDRNKTYCVQRLVIVDPQNPGVIDHIRKQLVSKHLSTRYLGVRHLKYVDYPELITDLINFVKNEKVEKILLKAIEVIGILKIQKAVSELNELIAGNKSKLIKQKSALAIAKIFE